MRRLACATVTLIAVVALCMPAPASANHGAQFFSHPWMRSAKKNFVVPFYFRDSFPAGAWRDRVRAGFGVWNARNQTLRWTEGSFDLGAYPNFRNRARSRTNATACGGTSSPNSRRRSP